MGGDGDFGLFCLEGFEDFWEGDEFHIGAVVASAG